MEAAEATASSTIYLTPVEAWRVLQRRHKSRKHEERSRIKEILCREQLKWKSLREAESEDASTYLWGIPSFGSMSIDKGTIRR